MRDLFQPVRGVKQRHAGGAQTVDLAEQDLHLAMRQHGRGFVHDQHPRLAGQGLGNLDHLPVGDGQITNAGIGIDAAFQLVQQRLGRRPLRLVVQEEAALLAPQKDVVGNGQILRQVELLMDDHHALRLGPRTRAEAGRRAIKQDLAFGRRQIAAKDLHHRRFAGAVFTDQGVDLAGIQGEVDAVQDLDGAETLADPAQLKCRRGGGHGVTHAPLRREERTQASTKRRPDRPSASVG
ncbi:hypothetical protein MASR1M32_22980 [Rhodobacter sp.]